MKFLMAAVMLVATVLGGCSSGDPPPPVPVIAQEQVSIFVIPKTSAACKQAGGNWTWPGAPYEHEPDDTEGMCIIKLPTAGDPCKSSDTCGAGFCLAEGDTESTGLGRCSHNNFIAGCKIIVTEGKAGDTICTD